MRRKGAVQTLRARNSVAWSRGPVGWRQLTSLRCWRLRARWIEFLFRHSSRFRPSEIRRRRLSRRRSRGRCGLEVLETRRVLAATLWVNDNGVLTYDADNSGT